MFRSTIVLVDEAAFLPDSQAIDSALAAVSDARIEYVDYYWRLCVWLRWLSLGAISLCLMYCGMACFADTGRGDWWYRFLRIDRLPASGRLLAGSLFTGCSMALIFHVLSQIQQRAMGLL